jgi:hypothetical protein
MQARAFAVFVAGLLLSGSIMLSETALAQTNAAQSPAGTLESNPIGRVVKTSGSVTIEHANAVIVQANLPTGSGADQTKVGDPVYKGDVVQTGADGKIGITFNDDTAFNLSSNARMVLNEYVYDPKGKSNSTLFSLTKGTFTFIAGKVAKTGDMKIDTPVATMGIRGTTPHVEISDDGSVKFSTLIEENKGAVTKQLEEHKSAVTKKRADIEENKGGVPSKQRQAKRSSSVQQAQKSPDNNFNMNLQICRGC